MRQMGHRNSIVIKSKPDIEIEPLLEERDPEECPHCAGYGWIALPYPQGENRPDIETDDCPACRGTGRRS